MVLSEQEKLKQLKFYLGKFFLKVDPQLHKFFHEKLPKPSNVIAVGNNRFLRNLGAYYLLAFGRQTYRFVFDYEIVDTFLGNNVDPNEPQTFYDTTSKLLIIYHMANTMENKQLEPMVCHNMTQRKMEGLHTIVMMETELKQVATVATNLEYQTIYQNQSMRSSSRSQEL